ncbi:helix-turn-helix transcriptional regulator [Agreia pratensis]|uniref:ArsR/SmtB family transcription factor n=1 Tax=Agreia pratensis TaxID=150121 RepID=UPI00188A8B3E|nr:helix-turn-helix domain-containing protein [Agreia pratensis]MBF4636226.1 helix-turn-helix transcriptional regulator [Agreia pratensis]
MPRMTTPPGMPEEVSAVIDAIGNRARGALLHELAQNGPLTAPELARRVSASRESIHRHLLELESFGLTRADTARGQRHGRLVSWSANVDRIKELVDIWRNYLIGH